MTHPRSPMAPDAEAPPTSAAAISLTAGALVHARAEIESDDRSVKTAPRPCPPPCLVGRGALPQRERADMSRPPLPPFNQETATQKVRMAEDGWNSKEPEKVALAYTSDSIWRNRAEFVEGRAAIEAFLTRKWVREFDYRLIKELWAFEGNRIAVRFAYEWHDDGGNWFRSYGNENWEFADDGLMQRRIASINDLPITEADRLMQWADGPRPEDHPGLTELGL